MRFDKAFVQSLILAIARAVLAEIAKETTPSSLTPYLVADRASRELGLGEINPPEEDDASSRDNA